MSDPVKAEAAAESIAKLRAAMSEHRVDAMLLVTEANIAYATGYHQEQHERFYALLVPAEGDPRLLVPGLEEPEAQRAVQDSGLQVFAWADEDGYERSFRSFLEPFGSAAAIAIETMSLPVAIYGVVKDVADRADFTDCGSLVDALRARKTPREIELIRGAAAATQRVLNKIPEHVFEGMSERQACEIIRALIMEEEVEDLAFGPFVISGTHSAFPQAHPGTRRLSQGEPVLIDFGAKRDGYCSDLARTFVVGAPTDRHRELDEVVRSAQAAAVDACVIGSTAADVDRAARGVLADAGLDHYFPHRTGHGVGLEFHEHPNVHGGNEEPLKAGMVLAIEPGIYIPEFGAIRVEDDVAVTRDGPDLLSTPASGVPVLG